VKLFEATKNPCFRKNRDLIKTYILETIILVCFEEITAVK